MKEIIGEDVAALLMGIHTHADIIAHNLDTCRNHGSDTEVNHMEGEIYYAEKDLLPILRALGLPEPIWGSMYSLKEWLEIRK